MLPNKLEGMKLVETERGTLSPSFPLISSIMNLSFSIKYTSISLISMVSSVLLFG